MAALFVRRHRAKFRALALLLLAFFVTAALLGLDAAIKTVGRAAAERNAPRPAALRG